MPNAKPVMAKRARNQSPDLPFFENFLRVQFQPILNDRNGRRVANELLRIKNGVGILDGHFVTIVVDVGAVKILLLLDLLLYFIDLMLEIGYTCWSREEHLPQKDNYGDDQDSFAHRGVSQKRAATRRVGAVAKVITVFKSHSAPSQLSHRFNTTI